MKSSRRIISFLFTMAIFFGTAVPSHAQDNDGPWRVCETGYTLEVSDEKSQARCVKAAIS